MRIRYFGHPRGLHGASVDLSLTAFDSWSRAIVKLELHVVISGCSQRDQAFEQMIREALESVKGKQSKNPCHNIMHSTPHPVVDNSLVNMDLGRSTCF